MEPIAGLQPADRLPTDYEKPGMRLVWASQRRHGLRPSEAMAILDSIEREFGGRALATLKLSPWDSGETVSPVFLVYVPDEAYNIACC